MPRIVTKISQKNLERAANRLGLKNIPSGIDKDGQPIFTQQTPIEAVGDYVASIVQELAIASYREEKNATIDTAEEAIIKDITREV